MRLRTCSTLLVLLTACASTAPEQHSSVDQNPRVANLQRAAALPWRDDGRCVVQEASHPWPTVVERCFHALDSRRIRFEDTRRQCPVASADAATLKTLIGICLLSQPELAVGAVIIVGTVVAAVAITEAIEEYTRRRHTHPEPESSQEDARPVPAPQTSTPAELSSNRRPAPQRSTSHVDLIPPTSGTDSRGPECEPLRVPPRGGNTFHNGCADRVPGNDFRGFNALVNGKRFDALQLATRTLWEVKTTAIETYNPYVQRIELQNQVDEGRNERDLAAACGYHFVIGVRTEAHKTMLEQVAPDLEVVLMPWC